MRSSIPFELGLEGVEQREVAVHHGVDQSVEHVAGAELQQLGLALAARAHGLKALRGVAADRQDVVRAREDVDLADAQALAVGLEQVQDDEQGIAVVLDLRPLVPVLRVLDRERVQSELRLHLLEHVPVALEQRDPDEAARHREIAVDLVRLDLPEPLAVLVGDAVDQHRRCDLLGEQDPGPAELRRDVLLLRLAVGDAQHGLLVENVQPRAELRASAGSPRRRP